LAAVATSTDQLGHHGPGDRRRGPWRNRDQPHTSPGDLGCGPAGIGCRAAADRWRPGGGDHGHRHRPAAAHHRASQYQGVAATGSISAPANGADVKNCAYFSGTSRLTSGRTLILAMRNLDNGDSNKYVETVFGCDKPQQLASWQGAQYFNGASGQRYRVELMSVDLAAAKAAGHDVDATNALAAGGTSLASRDVVRVDGNVGNDCPGP
jgi:hypothetical protein